MLEATNRTLVIFFLTIQSSYSGNTEQPASDEAFDTVQFFQSDSGAWRIKTFAMDQDVHVWSLGGKVGDIVTVARSNTEKHYGDVLLEGYISKSSTGFDGLRQELESRGLSTHLEISDSGLVFWTPEGTRYRSKSKPR
ncbi:MAG TPA: hypothetical protein VGD45_26935 [Steroidobacter sp.]|uniref:hypothetical protein n=1 Tax=Steroidobacter sp. TaxID=1978227 RepID=UPI002ED7A523